MIIAIDLSYKSNVELTTPPNAVAQLLFRVIALNTWRIEGDPTEPACLHRSFVQEVFQKLQLPLINPIVC